MIEESALVIVDVQIDFCPVGALPVPDGDSIIPILNAYIDAFGRNERPVFATRDWHPPESQHFRDHGGKWPAHCVQGTPGAGFHPKLNLPASAIVISKGTEPDADGYTAFDGRDAHGVPLASTLGRLRVRQLLVGGLATDYCVRATVLNALDLGFSVRLLRDAIRGVDADVGDSERAIEEMTRRGAVSTTLTDLDTSQGPPKGGPTP